MAHLHDQNEFWEEEGKAKEREIKELEEQIRGHETALFRARQQAEELGAASEGAAVANAQLEKLKQKFDRELAEKEKALQKAKWDADAAEAAKVKALKSGELLQARLVAAEEQVLPLLILLDVRIILHHLILLSSCVSCQDVLILFT